MTSVFFCLEFLWLSNGISFLLHLVLKSVLKAFLLISIMILKKKPTVLTTNKTFFPQQVSGISRQSKILYTLIRGGKKGGKERNHPSSVGNTNVLSDG